jgi:DNA-binding response OmpR family regulator
MKKILIIHDYAGIREPLAEKLAAEGYLVVPIGRPSLAKELILTLNPDLVLIKLDKGKQAFFDEVRKQSPSLPILALTTLDGPEKDLRSKLAGVYVIRNPGFDGLQQKVADVLHRKTPNFKEQMKSSSMQI